uniref:Uncharacterized protein n=1 Tax=Rhizophora mucronata TaxID=61149 RepID=A0A2P2PNF5_RHIMU
MDLSCLSEGTAWIRFWSLNFPLSASSPLFFHSGIKSNFYLDFQDT